jgi:hypothetical protein
MFWLLNNCCYNWNPYKWIGFTDSNSPMWSSCDNVVSTVDRTGWGITNALGTVQLDGSNFFLLSFIVDLYFYFVIHSEVYNIQNLCVCDNKSHTNSLLTIHKFWRMLNQFQIRVASMFLPYLCSLEWLLRDQ